MAVVVVAETWEGKFKKASFEAVSYGARVAKSMGTEAVAITLGTLTDNPADLGKYGASKILTLAGDEVATFNNARYATAIAGLASDAHVYIVSGTNNGKMLAPFLAVAAKAALITNVTALPESTSPIRVKRGAFSAKGIAFTESTAATTVICIVPNSVGIEALAAAGEVQAASAQSNGNIRVAKIESVDKVKGKIPLPEAELVVSAGRGMKAPENWNLIEDLAESLGAATACSKPVSDIGWRPHSEHVGQTGIQINPNLYIAIGISGAIQHLAGVSASKTIVVINSDADAPFFKAADYGIVGDAFEIVPKLTEAIKAFKAHN